MNNAKMFVSSELHQQNAVGEATVGDGQLLTTADFVFDVGGRIVTNNPTTKTKTNITIQITHRTESSLEEVGTQVWLGSLLMCDYFIHCNNSSFISENEVHNKTVLDLRDALLVELGGGTGLCSILASRLFNTSHVLCTDMSGPVLELCRFNIRSNELNIRNNQQLLYGDTSLSQHQKQQPLTTPTLEALPLDFFDAKSHPIVTNVPDAEWTRPILNLIHHDPSRRTIYFASDPIYDFPITKAFVELLSLLLTNTPPTSTTSPREDPICILSLEKRINFSIAALDQVAEEYDYFFECLAANGLRAVQLDTKCIQQSIEYNRTPQLELWIIKR